MKKERKEGDSKSSAVISDRPALFHHTPAFPITFITDAIFGGGVCDGGMRAGMLC